MTYYVHRRWKIFERASATINVYSSPRTIIRWKRKSPCNSRIAVILTNLNKFLNNRDNPRRSRVSLFDDNWTCFVFCKFRSCNRFKMHLFRSAVLEYSALYYRERVCFSSRDYYSTEESRNQWFPRPPKCELCNSKNLIVQPENEIPPLFEIYFDRYAYIYFCYEHSLPR